MITGILFILTAILYLTSSDKAADYVNLAGMAFMLLGLVGIYLRQMKEVGMFGFIVFIITFIGSVLWAGFGWAGTFIKPLLEDQAPELLKQAPPGMMPSMLTFFIGLFLFGIVTALKGVLPRVAAILLILVPILNFVPYGEYVAQPLGGISLLWLGYAVWKGKYENSKVEG
ncbi:hypothetical protein [Bacillus sp. UNC438CL73TsuS30]|uniref:hypothetical protein n=1 Tax=Bacillus sp. UNC438CL73TsuS30 TaxID=1340434 RepID=UPI00047A50F7|nr:hypothetical protein [Bacillus sp. UNC438CL73TsuS30]